MLIMQGTNDPRVPPSESEQIVAALAGSKTPVWYVLFDAEGHGFRRRVNTDYDSAVTALFRSNTCLAQTDDTGPARDLRQSDVGPRVSRLAARAAT
jgi:dienelactone hydrolase